MEVSEYICEAMFIWERVLVQAIYLEYRITLAIADMERVVRIRTMVQTTINSTRVKRRDKNIIYPYQMLKTKATLSPPQAKARRRRKRNPALRRTES